MNDLTVLKVEWLLTRRCNLACSYCKIVDQSSLAGKELSFEDVKTGLRYIKKRWPFAPVIFFGGEPTVISWLPELVEFCEGEGIKYAIISNSVRVTKDLSYAEKLVKKGLSNWSVSIDRIENFGDSDADYKSFTGFMALKMFQDMGVKDLVACTTVSKWNIEDSISIVQELSSNGIYDILTILQLGHPGFEYSGGDIAHQCRDEKTIKKVSRKLYEMAKSGKYLMHNTPEYFLAWDTYAIEQNWKCSKKSALTIDADGSLKRCVDQKGGLEKFNILTLKDKEAEYKKALKEPNNCKGCFWDPAWQSEQMASQMKPEDAYKLFRHELTEEQVNKLIPAARKFFK